MPAEPKRRSIDQPQACKPCRKAKTRCDHGSPKCSRCALRSLNCVYHSAPMARRHRYWLFPMPTYLQVSPQPDQLPTTDTQPPIEAIARADSGSVASLGPSPNHGGTKQKTLFQKQAVEHETTRFSVVFFENQDSLGPVIHDITNFNHEPNQEIDATTSSHMDLAINTLLNFPTIRTCEKLIAGIHDIHDVWFGAVQTAFTTAGLHHLPPLKTVTPYSQHRAAIATSMYYLDKCHSLFAARPPMLSRRYCQCSLPLDLCEKDVYGGQERLAAAVMRLDSNGWNTDDRIFTTTWLRALAMLSPIREGILELSLSVNLQFTKAQLLHILHKSNTTVARKRPRSQSRGRSLRDLYIITRILFDIAHQTISIILSLWLNRDLLQNFNHTFYWITVSYGMPCAGILCVELLQA
ncbi:hypothetical protein BDV06DRAFT_65449 [Aspergillus oleicola]